MKKQLLYLLPLFVLCVGAVSIKWFNDYPAGRPLATNDIVALQRTGPNRYVYGDLNDVKNAIGAGGGGAQVWTNDGSAIFIPSATNNTIFLGRSTVATVPDTNKIAAYLAGTDEMIDFTTYPYGIGSDVVSMKFNYLPDSLVTKNYTNDISCLARFRNETESRTADNYPYIVSGTIALKGESGSNSDSTNGAAIAVQGVAYCYTTVEVGIHAYTETLADYQTNVGMMSVALQRNNNNITVAGYFETDNGYPPTDPPLQNSVLHLDNRRSGFPLILASTNGGTIVASLGSSGVWTNQGTVYPSNATPAIPTVADLGAGGFWDGNSNGFKVTVYSDGANTSMKVWGPPF